ncbi:MAG: bifunctional helix-turn-helix domain-containing protein/methylated-DNA--[protein]-cysteine S-methyltransferase [Pseudomonadota bacterium]
MNAENQYHYHIIGRAIEAIDASETPVSLEDLAAEAGLSPAHFQRTFTAWAGVSPKKFQQYLTLGHAKNLLKNRFTTLETAHSVGLSGSSRLHDLFIRWEAMSPGDFARGGAESTIYWGYFDTPFGDALAMGTGKGLCGLAFTEEFGREVAMADMQSRWPYAAYEEKPEVIQRDVEAAFGGGETNLLLIGRPLQIKVWEALMRIPSGQVTTYSELAQSVGSPKAVRAVGTAVGRNPISFIIPCHRALRKSGGLGGYHWGLPVKRTMLAWEAAQRDMRAENRSKVA